MNCDHTILQFHYDNRLLTISNFVLELSYHTLEDTMIIKKYLDQRRGYTRLFKFCPDCGKKINWKQIRKNLDNTLP